MKRIWLILGLTLLLASCEKELDFKYHDVESRLVIEGNITESGASVKLTNTSPMDAPIDNSYITDAQVVITDVTSDESRNLSVAEDGLYYDTTSGIPGHEYRLDVHHNGDCYSSFGIMRPAPKILGLEFQWIKMPYDYVAVLGITFTDFETVGDCYWIRLYRNGESYAWLLSDDRSSVNGVIKEVTMTSRKDIDEEDDKSVLKDGDKIKVSISSISREMYDYLIAIQSDSNGPQMFTGAFCLGYFMASCTTENTITFHPDEITEFH